MQGLRRLIRDLVRANQPTYATDASGNITGLAGTLGGRLDNFICYAL